MQKDDIHTNLKIKALNELGHHYLNKNEFKISQ